MIRRKEDVHKKGGKGLGVRGGKEKKEKEEEKKLEKDGKGIRRGD